MQIGFDPGTLALPTDGVAVGALRFANDPGGGGFKSFEKIESGGLPFDHLEENAVQAVQVINSLLGKGGKR